MHPTLLAQATIEYFYKELGVSDENYNPSFTGLILPADSITSAAEPLQHAECWWVDKQKSVAMWVILTEDGYYRYLCDDEEINVKLKKEDDRLVIADPTE